MPSAKEDVIGAIQKHANGKTFLDLGSGDGRVVQWARECGATESEGAEIEKEFFDDHSIAVPGCHQRNLFSLEWGSYGCLFYYLYGCSHEHELAQKLRKEHGGILILNTAQCGDILIQDFKSMIRRSPNDAIGTCLVFDFSTPDLIEQMHRRKHATDTTATYRRGQRNLSAGDEPERPV